MKLDNLNEIDLLKLNSTILQELKKRNVIRTLNNPIADYCEWLVAKKFDWKLENSSKSGYDCIDDKKKRVQIKCRKIESKNASKQLGIIRNLDKNPFDYLIAIIFSNDYEVIEAYKISKKLIRKYSRISDHQNGLILSLKGEILNDKELVNITNSLK